MPRQKWTPAETADAAALDWDTFSAKYPHRNADSYRLKRNRIEAVAPTPSPYFTSDKKIGDFHWRDGVKLLQEMQTVKQAASWSQDTAHITFDVDHPICVLGISDFHLGSWATDYDAFARITEEIIDTPDLYIAVLGDMEQMSIKLRNVLEVSDNALPPELQHAMIESWLTDVADKILFSTWDNHSVMREEAQAGSSQYKRLMSRRVIWHNGIGHPTIQVGGEQYRLAVSHTFRGRSIENPVHGCMRYMRREGQDREIAMAGDSHVPGIAKYTDGPTVRLALNCGSLQVNSGYAKRFFSLATHEVFPCFTLHPDRHLFTPYWSVAEYLAASVRGA